MYCSECGQRNPDTARFCAFCGAKLLATPLPEQDTVSAPDWDAESIFDKPAPSARTAADQKQPEAREAVPDREKPGTSVKKAPAHAKRTAAETNTGAETPVDRAGVSGRTAAYVPARRPDTGARRTTDARPKQSSWQRPSSEPVRSARIVATHSAARSGEAPRAEQGYSPWAKPSSTDRAAMQAARNGAPSTIVPRRNGGRPSPEEAPSDLFFDGYDEEPEVRTFTSPRDEDERREMRRLSYVERNVRGFIGVGLTLVTLVILAAWLFLFPSGQMMLARFGLTNNPRAYANIAVSAYNSQNYATAARNYYQALLLDSDNYDYAIWTAQSYMQAGNTGSASTALTMAIDIDASDKRAYQMLQQLYPDAQTRPTAVAELLSQGATLTGDSTLTQ